MRKIIFVASLLIACISAQADNIPTLSISFDAVDGSGSNKQENAKFYEGSAPITATFRYTVSGTEGWDMSFEWRFCHEGGTLDDPYMIRYEPEPEITFSQGGTDSIALYATFVRGTERVEMHREYWSVEDNPLVIRTSESSLVLPNAFSPNGDGKNDFYKPKSYQSIVEFRAIIYNRWGQKVYEWDDVSADGWDGTFNGKDVKQGVYFAYVRAKGADGRTFEFKKDVNLLRTFEGEETSSGGLSDF